MYHKNTKKKEGVAKQMVRQNILKNKKWAFNTERDVNSIRLYYTSKYCVTIIIVAQFI